MYAKAYQNLAARTINEKLTQKEMIDHALKGMCAELGELQGLYQKIYQGHELDREKLAKELGDIAWYLAETATALDLDLEDIFQANIDKLKKRYPEGFDSARSINRK